METTLYIQLSYNQSDLGQFGGNQGINKLVLFLQNQQALFSLYLLFFELSYNGIPDTCVNNNIVNKGLNIVQGQDVIGPYAKLKPQKDHQTKISPKQFGYRQYLYSPL
eukprot:TRINITY_DN99846_c0_g1_i5.p4 TRINITY_DN99846_c0_g1~~TRINITY_DN99846_c0_g1_i5.p4  ORF type:complete len:108 (+),score=0.43 TRINITY_DN99846_c0_g1_i5:310-633(+)